MEGVGCIGLGSFFNSYVYRARARTLERVVGKFKMSFKDKEVLARAGLCSNAMRQEDV